MITEPSRILRGGFLVFQENNNLELAAYLFLLKFVFYNIFTIFEFINRVWQKTVDSMFFEIF